MNNAEVRVSEPGRQNDALIEVSILTQADEPQYKKLLGRTQHGIYATLDYRDFLKAVSSGEPDFLIARRSGQVCGAIPRFRKTVDRIGTVYNALPWFGSHGGCLVAEDDPDKKQVRRVLMGRFAEDARCGDVISSTFITYPEESGHDREYKDVLKPTTMDQRVGQVTYLPEGKDRINDRLLSLFGQKTRNLVRKALRQGFTVTCEETDEAWEFLRTTHEENMAAVGGTAKPKSHFMALRSVFAANCRVWQAQADGKFVAAVLLMYYQDTVEYFIPVVKREYRSRQPLSLLIFEAMKDAVVRGFKIWNWGGTWASQKSLHHFKAGFGAIDRPYKYYIITDVGIRDLLQNAKSEITRNFPNWYLYPYAEL